MEDDFDDDLGLPDDDELIGESAPDLAGTEPEADIIDVVEVTTVRTSGEVAPPPRKARSTPRRKPARPAPRAKARRAKPAAKKSPKKAARKSPAAKMRSGKRAKPTRSAGKRRRR
jgi:hypothetical protein